MIQMIQMIQMFNTVLQMDDGSPFGLVKMNFWGCWNDPFTIGLSWPFVADHLTPWWLETSQFYVPTCSNLWDLKHWLSSFCSVMVVANVPVIFRPQRYRSIRQRFRSSLGRRWPCCWAAWCDGHSEKLQPDQELDPLDLIICSKKWWTKSELGLRVFEQTSQQKN